MGSGLVAAGVAVGRAHRFARDERMAVAAAFVVMGLSQLRYLWIQRMPWLAVLGVGVSVLTQTVVAVGLLIMYLRSRVDEERFLADQREMALARVLSDFVTICAYCKSIRSEAGDWQPPRQYVERHTEMSVATQLCPGCAAESS
jgi:hypothetical protein